MDLKIELEPKVVTCNREGLMEHLGAPEKLQRRRRHRETQPAGAVGVEIKGDRITDLIRKAATEVIRVNKVLSRNETDTGVGKRERREHMMATKIHPI